MAENPFAQFSLEKAIGLRWTLRDIQARRLKMSPVSDEDLKTLTGLGLVEVRDEGLVLTPGWNCRAERGRSQRAFRKLSPESQGVQR